MKEEFLGCTSISAKLQMDAKMFRESLCLIDICLFVEGKKEGQKKSSHLVSFALPQMYICFEKLQTILLLTY